MCFVRIILMGLNSLMNAELNVPTQLYPPGPGLFLAVESVKFCYTATKLNTPQNRE